MRVLYAADRIDRRGGAGRHLLQVIDWAVSAGHRVTVAAGRIESGALEPAVRSRRVRALASRMGCRSGLEDLAHDLARADVVHVQNVMNPVALDLARQGGRAVVTVQDHRLFCPGPGKTLPSGRRCRIAMADEPCSECLAETGYRRRLLEVTQARLAAVCGARLVVLSRYMAAELAAVGVSGAQVIPPAFEVWRGEPEPGDGFLLAGRLVAHKAPREGWAAWRRSGSGMPLRVAGDGRERQALDGATQLGWLGPADLERELRRSRALLFPSRWQEPFGMVGVEALAQATPVVAFRSGGTGEWTDAGCFVVDAGDVEAMAGALDELARDRGRAVRLGSSGREMVAERFSSAAISRRLQLLYESVADRSDEPS